MDLYKAIQLRALANVLLDDEQNPDSEQYFLRQVFRWYSRQFHVPLMQIAQLPLADVLLHYFECLYEQLEDPQLEAERVRLTETAEEKSRREMAEADDVADFELWADEVQRMEQERIAKKERGEPVGLPSLPKKALPTPVRRPAAPKAIKEAAIPEAASIPIVSMTFEDTAAFEREVEMDGMRPPDPPKKKR